MGQRVDTLARGAWTSAWVADVSPRTGPGEKRRDASDLADADDRTLVHAFQNGRPEAFDLIVVRYRQTIYQLCYRFAGNHEDASDLAQDVFVRAFRGLARFKGDSALGTWLYRIGVNTSLNRVAARKPPAESIEEREHVDAASPDPLQGLVQDEKAARVRAAIRRLPPKQRATLILRVYHELSHEEIAKTLGGTVGAVKANFFHALGNLKRLIR